LALSLQSSTSLSSDKNALLSAILLKRAFTITNEENSSHRMFEGMLLPFQCVNSKMAMELACTSAMMQGGTGSPDGSMETSRREKFLREIA
jgi:hypothetical protein